MANNENWFILAQNVQNGLEHLKPVLITMFRNNSPLFPCICDGKWNIFFSFLIRMNKQFSVVLISYVFFFPSIFILGHYLQKKHLMICDICGKKWLYSSIIVQWCSFHKLCRLKHIRIWICISSNLSVIFSGSYFLDNILHSSN